jgi:putative FmdB family regulatory protein
VPLFEYRCDTCGSSIDLLVKHADDAVAPECGSCKTSMKRKIGRTSFILNGGGWAKDGYGSSTPK